MARVSLNTIGLEDSLDPALVRLFERAFVAGWEHRDEHGPGPFVRQLIVEKLALDALDLCVRKDPQAPPPPGDGKCNYCGHPAGSTTCQRSHP